MSDSFHSEERWAERSFLVTRRLVTEIASTLETKKMIDDTVISELRCDYPNLRFTLCYDTEMGAREPYEEFKTFDLHLVAHSATGCSALTDALNHCSGFVIALHDD
jgi:hypothetical protein